MMNGPLFNNARGEASTLQMAPPFAFSDVTMTVFPLQANLARLTQFTQGYLNQAPDIVQFRPFLPYVYLIILDYGRMSTQAARTGWVSQREVAFGVPLQWMQPTPDGLRFHDWAFTTPFIFVDNELSLSTGREVYGWPKLLSRLDPSIDRWVSDPHGARRVFEISSQAADDRAGDAPLVPFLTVTQTPVAGLADMPPRLDTLADAVQGLPQAVSGIARMWRDVANTFAQMAANRARDMPDPQEMGTVPGQNGVPHPQGALRDIPGRMLGALFPKLYSNTINLKQFRDAAQPDDTCYQAVTAARMPIQRIGGGGLLGMENMALGQLNGGYHVHILNSSAVPIVDTLGLQSSESRDVGGGRRTTLSPVCPFWVKLDMLYGTAETLAWRARQGNWRTTQGAPGVAETAQWGATRLLPPVQTPEGQAAREQANSVQLIEPSNPFNTTRGASEAIGGALRLPGATVRVLPLLADPGVLEQFVRDYVQVPGHLRVEPWGQHVYLIVAHYPRMSAELDPTATGSGSEMTFSVPVKCYDDTAGDETSQDPPDWVTSGPGDPDARAAAWRKGAGRLIGTALLSPFSFVDDIRLAISQSEVFGVPTLRAGISSPPQGWTDKRAGSGILAEARAIVVPSLNTQSEGSRQSLITVHDAPVLPDWDTDGWRHLAATWGPHAQADLDRKFTERGPLRPEGASPLDGPWFPLEAARSLSLDIFGGETGVNTLSLKQFRDAAQPDKACYQGVVLKSTRVEWLDNLTPIDRDLTVSIARFPTQPIGRILGLIPKRTVVTKDGLIDDFEALRPFELTGDLIRDSGQTLFERAADDVWAPVHLAQGVLGWRSAAPTDLDPVAHEKPSPKLCYAYRRTGQDVIERHAPHVMTAAALTAFHDAAQTHALSDLKLLRRRFPVNLMFRSGVLDALDRGEVADIAALVDTLDADPMAPPRLVEAYALAGALELISPATVLDTLLNRGWGLRHKTGVINSPITASDFRLRTGSFGPQPGLQMFPISERQDGYWPPSSDWETQATRDLVAQMVLLRTEFWVVINSYRDDPGRNPSSGLGVADHADNVAPAWFRPPEKGTPRALVPHVKLFEYWTGDMLADLRDSLISFFGSVEGHNQMDDDLRIWKGLWLQTIDRLIQDNLEGGAWQQWPTGPEAVTLMANRLTTLGLGAGVIQLDLGDDDTGTGRRDRAD